MQDVHDQQSHIRGLGKIHKGEPIGAAARGKASAGGHRQPQPYKNVVSIRAVINKLISAEWQLDTPAKVLGISLHDGKHFRMLPISFEASCNRFTASHEADRLRCFSSLWDNVKDIYGPLVSLSSDADSGHIACDQSMAGRLVGIKLPSSF